MIKTIIKHLSVLLISLILVVVLSQYDAQLVEVLSGPIGLTAVLLMVFIGCKIAEITIG